MMKYQLKPVIYDVEQFNGVDYPGVLLGADVDVTFTFAPKNTDESDSITIHNPDGDVRVNPGDWVVRSERGYLASYSNDMFTSLFTPLGGVTR